MSRGDTSLRGLLGHQEEVEDLVVLTILNQRGIDDGTWWRVGNIMTSLSEHPLIDSLVNHNESNLGNIHSVGHFF